jgi:hypothetical protein
VSSADELNADLIVRSTHGRSGPIRAVLGSVADEVVRTSKRPVMLLPRRAAWRFPAPSLLTEPATFVSYVASKEVEHA